MPRSERRARTALAPRLRMPVCRGADLVTHARTPQMTASCLIEKGSARVDSLACHGGA